MKIPDALKQYLMLAVKIIIAAAIIFMLIKMNSDGKLIAAFSGINYFWLIPAAACYAIHLFFNAFRWYILLKAQGIQCALSEAVSISMQSLFFSLVIPGGALGGDIVRITFLTRKVPPEQRFDGGFTILMDRFIGMIAMFLVALLMLPFCRTYLQTSDPVTHTLIKVLIAGCVCGLLAAAAVFNHRKLEKIKLYVILSKLADKITKGLFSKVTDALDKYDDKKKTVFICVIASIIFVDLMLGAALLCLCFGFAPDWKAIGATLGAIQIGNIAGVIPLTPSGFGARDYFLVPVLQNGGMKNDVALAVTLCYSAMILFYNLSGSIFFLFSSHKKYQNTAQK